jgi:putative membrane protein
VTTAIRCITRQILVLVPPPELSGLHTVVSTDSMLPNNIRNRAPSSTSIPRDSTLDGAERGLSKFDELRTIETVKILIAMLYTIKNHLRAEWGVALSPGTSLTADGQEATHEEYKDLLPIGLKGYEHRGLGLTLELATFVEKFVTDGVRK